MHCSNQGRKSPKQSSFSSCNGPNYFSRSQSPYTVLYVLDRPQTELWLLSVPCLSRQMISSAAIERERNGVKPRQSDSVAKTIGLTSQVTFFMALSASLIRQFFFLAVRLFISSMWGMEFYPWVLAWLMKSPALMERRICRSSSIDPFGYSFYLTHPISFFLGLIFRTFWHSLKSSYT